jgi:hypothetical protein
MRDGITAWRLLWDPRVPTILKLALPLLAVVYWLSPLDLLPGLPFDDIAVLLVALRMFVSLAPQQSVNDAFNGGPSAGGNPAGQPPRRGEDDQNVIDTTWRVLDD